jgi:hypothetical protein
VAELAEGGRLTGEEPNLIAGWSFDDFTPDAFERFPPVVTRPLTDSGPAYRIPLSWPVVDATDAAQFDNPFLIAPTETVFRLPFPVNEVWRVSQGYDVPGGSHNGYAAFSYDFVKVSSPVPGPAIVSASASGKIVHVNETVDNDPEKPLEPYVVVIENGALEYSTYLHLALESWTKVFLKGEPLLNGPTQDDLERAVPVEQGDNLAEVGPNGNHLHYDTFSHLGLGGNFPSAFEAYYMSEDEGKTWTYVSRGIPQTGQWLRHDP